MHPTVGLITDYCRIGLRVNGLTGYQTLGLMDQWTKIRVSVRVTHKTVLKDFVRLRPRTNMT